MRVWHRLSRLPDFLSTDRSQPNMPWAWHAPFSFASNLLCDRLPQQGPRVVAAIKRAQRAARHFPAVLVTSELPAVGADPVDAKTGRRAVAGKFARRGLPVGCDDLKVGRRYRRVPIEMHARQSREMTKAAGDRGLVLGRPHDRGDCLVSGGALAAA